MIYLFDSICVTVGGVLPEGLFMFLNRVLPGESLDFKEIQKFINATALKTILGQ